MRSEPAFWDTSAVVPLCCRQSETSTARRMLGQYGRMAVWWGTRVEACSALVRLRRQGALTPQACHQALDRLAVLSRSWYELLPVEPVREQAEELLGRYSLTAGDALQLAAALVWCERRPQRRLFVCFDRRLAEVAAEAGFEVGRTPR